MSHIVDPLNRFGHKRQPLSSAGLPATQQRAMGESFGGVRWQVVVALALVLIAGLLFWGLNPWHSGEKGRLRGDLPSSRQPAQVANQGMSNLLGAASGRGAGQRQPKPEGKGLALNDQHQPSMMHSRNAWRNHIAADQPPEVEYEPPSEQRVRAILEDASGPVPSPSATDEEGNPPANVHRTRSQARSIALSDVTARMPPAYYDKEARREAAALAARVSDSSKVPSRESERRPDGASETSSDKTAASADPVAFKELPSQIKEAISLSISMFVYSKNADERRMVINGSTRREGQEVSPGLRLEAISPDGGVFSYQGYRFHKAVRED